MSKFTSQDNENVVNIDTNHGNIILPKKDEPKNEKHAPNHLYGFFGLLAFFGLLTFAIIYAIPKSPEPNNANTAVVTGITQTDIANTTVNSPVNNQTAEPDKKTSINTTVKYPKKPDPAPTVNRPKIPKQQTGSNSDFKPSDCSGTSNGCQ